MGSTNQLKYFCYKQSEIKYHIQGRWSLGHAAQSDRQVWSVGKWRSRQQLVQYSDDSVDCMDYRRLQQHRRNNPPNSWTRTCCPGADADTWCRTTDQDRCMYDTRRDIAGSPDNTVLTFIWFLSFTSNTSSMIWSVSLVAQYFLVVLWSKSGSMNAQQRSSSSLSWAHHLHKSQRYNNHNNEIHLYSVHLDYSVLFWSYHRFSWVFGK